MQKGEVWWADLTLPSGRRPVVLLTRTRAYDRRLSVTVAPVTKTWRRIPTEVTLGPEDGLAIHSVANLDDIITIPKTQLIERISQLSPEKMREVRAAIVFALDLGPDA